MRLIQITVDTFKSQHHFCLLRLQARLLSPIFFVVCSQSLLKYQHFLRAPRKKNIVFLDSYSFASILGLSIDFLSSAANVVHFYLVFSSQVTEIYGWPKGDETRLLNRHDQRPPAADRHWVTHFSLNTPGHTKGPTGYFAPCVGKLGLFFPYLLAG